MLAEISKIVSFLNPNNWSLKYWAILMLGSSLLIALPYFLKTPALATLQSGPFYLALIVVVCISVAGFVVTSIEKYIAFWKRGKALAKTQSERESYLHTLTVEEKRLLCGYILDDTKTQIFHLDDGVVNGLVRAGIIYRTSAEGTIDGHAYNIHDWAWTYLKLTEDFLTEGIPTDQTGGILPYDNSGSPMGRFMNRFRRW